MVDPLELRDHHQALPLVDDTGRSEVADLAAGDAHCHLDPRVPLARTPPARWAQAVARSSSPAEFGRLRHSPEPKRRATRGRPCSPPRAARASRYHTPTLEDQAERIEPAGDDGPCPPGPGCPGDSPRHKAPAITGRCGTRSCSRNHLCDYRRGRAARRGPRAPADPTGNDASSFRRAAASWCPSPRSAAGPTKSASTSEASRPVSFVR